MIRRSVLKNIAKLRDTLEDAQRFSRLIIIMENGGYPIKAMEYKARKLGAIQQMAELIPMVLSGLKELAPNQKKRITEMKLRSWVIRDRVNDFAYPEVPYLPLDEVFEPERHPFVEFFLKWKKRPAEESIMIHGEELMILISAFFIALGNHDKLTR